MSLLNHGSGAPTSADIPPPAPMELAGSTHEPGLRRETPDELEVRVEAVIDALTDSLVDDWLADLKARGFVKSEDQDGSDENETGLLFAFWDAARAVIRDLLVHGVTLAQTPNAHD